MSYDTDEIVSAVQVLSNAARERSSITITSEELDSAVVEKVMGWEVFDLGYYGTEEETSRMLELLDWINKVGIEAVGRYAIDVEKDFWCEMSTEFGNWSPSTSFEAAMQVVEKLNLTTTFSRRLNYKPQWGVALTVPNREDYACGESDSLPEAICRAALAAVENTQ